MSCLTPDGPTLTPAAFSPFRNNCLLCVVLCRGVCMFVWSRGVISAWQSQWGRAPSGVEGWSLQNFWILTTWNTLRSMFCTLKLENFFKSMTVQNGHTPVHKEKINVKSLRAFPGNVKTGRVRPCYVWRILHSLVDFVILGIWGSPFHDKSNMAKFQGIGQAMQESCYVEVKGPLIFDWTVGIIQWTLDVFWLVPSAQGLASNWILCCLVVRLCSEAIKLALDHFPSNNLSLRSQVRLGRRNERMYNVLQRVICAIFVAALRTFESVNTQRVCIALHSLYYSHGIASETGCLIPFLLVFSATSSQSSCFKLTSAESLG